MSGARVLIVDDEPQILRFLKPSLTAAGYDVVAAATGQRRALQTLSCSNTGADPTEVRCPLVAHR